MNGLKVRKVELINVVVKKNVKMQCICLCKEIITGV